MRSFIVTLSAKYQLLFIVLCTIIIAFGSALIIYLLFGSADLIPKAGLITSIYKVLGTIYAVLIAFSISGVWQNYCASELAVAAEAAALLDLAHIMRAFNEKKSQPFCAIAINYLKQVIKLEWPLLAKGQNEKVMSPTSSTYILSLKLVREVQMIQPQNPRDTVIFSSALNLLTKWLDARRTRIMISKGNIAFALWPMLIAGAIILFAFHGLFIVENHRLWATLLLLFSSVIGLSFYLIFTLDCPFGGTPAVGSGPFNWTLTWLSDQKSPDIE